MKKSLIALSCLAVLLIVAFFLSPVGRKCSALFTLTSSEDVSAYHFPDAYHEGEEQLKQGNTHEVRRIIEEGKATAKDSIDYYRFEVLNAKYYFYTMQADSFMYSHRRLQSYIGRQKNADNLELRLLKMECEMQLGVYETKMVGRMDSALEHNMKALDMAERLNCDPDYRLLILINIADVYKQMGRYDQSVRYFRDAMELGDSLGMSDATRITLDIGIASAYAAMHNFEQSAVWWKLAAQMKPLMKRTELFHYLNNRGNDYYLQERYSESMACFLELDSVISRDPDMHWECMYGRCNLSAVNIKLGHPERAKKLLDETEHFFTEQKQPIPLYYLTTQRIELALNEGRIDEASRLDKENPTPHWMIPEQVQLRRKELMRLYQLTGKWKEYGEQLKAYMLLKDSMTSDNTNMRFSEALMHYEHDKALMEKQLQLEEKELSYRWAIAVLVVSGLVIILLVIIIIMKHRERKLRESEMRGRIAGLRMETVRNRITPHFISNALSVEIMAQMDGKQADLDSLVQLLHRGIELTDVEQSTLSEELEFIRFYCDIESRSIGDDFRFSIQLDSGVDADNIILPSMCIQILVENAIKHGLKPKPRKEGQLRTVLVRATRQEQATLVEVIDNGVGLPSNRKVKERTGLRVVKQTIILLNEQNLQAAPHGSHPQLMDCGLENYTHADGEHGCRAWILLPDEFDYRLQRLPEHKER